MFKKKKTVEKPNRKRIKYIASVQIDCGDIQSNIS